MKNPVLWNDVYSLIAVGAITKAIELSESSPYHEEESCQRFLGSQYYLQKKYESALTWYSRAAADGDCGAKFGKGLVFFALDDFKSALLAFQEAAKCGFHRAHYWAAIVYERHLGEDKDLEKAAYHYARSAEFGYFAGKAGLIRVAKAKGSIFRKIFLQGKLIYLAMQAIPVGWSNLNDPRLTDCPNIFEKKRNP